MKNSVKPSRQILKEIPLIRWNFYIVNRQMLIPTEEGALNA